MTRRIPLGRRFDWLGACLLVCRRPVIGQGLLVRGRDDNKRKWGREEKELHRKLDIFQRFSTKEDHDKFISELNTEMQLRKK
eukprot:COSAG06_NODE_2079_length_7643_cov_20.586957_12_plen_82_part_00